MNMDKLLLSRAALGHILAACTHHGDFAAYYQQFNHKNATFNCLCGRPKSPLHFYFCKKSTIQRLTYKIPTSEAIPWLLGTAKGAIKLAD